MTDGQIKDMFTMLEYTAKLVVDVRADAKVLRQELVKLREVKEAHGRTKNSLAVLRRDHAKALKEIRYLHKLLDDKFK